MFKLNLRMKKEMCNPYKKLKNNQIANNKRKMMMSLKGIFEYKYLS